MLDYEKKTNTILMFMNRRFLYLLNLQIPLTGAP